MVKIPEKALEIAEAVKNPKVQLGKAFDKARSTIIGSGSIPEEIERTFNAYIDMPVTAVTTPLKALADLVALHPINATKDIIQGGLKLIKDNTEAVTSVTRFGVAGAVAAGGIVKETAKLPFKGIGMIAKSPFRVWDAINNGVNNLSQSFAKMGANPEAI